MGLTSFILRLRGLHSMFTRTFPLSLFLALFVFGLVHGGIVVVAALFTIWSNQCDDIENEPRRREGKVVNDGKGL